jgi:hypothetical protein
MIDAKEFQKARQQVETLRLKDFDPQLPDDLRQICPESNSPIDVGHYANIQERIKVLAGEYETTGLPIKIRIKKS